MKRRPRPRELRTTPQGNIPYPDRPGLWRRGRMATIMHLAACLTLTLGAQIQDAQKTEPPPVLVPPPLAEELKLDEQQRRKVDDLEKEFQQQRKAALTM